MTFHLTKRYFFRPDSSTTTQGDENNNHNPPAAVSPSTSPNNSQRYSPVARFDASVADSGKTNRKVNTSTKTTKKRNLLQEVPTKYFSAKKTIMLNFLNGSEQQKTRKADEEEIMEVDEYQEDAVENRSKSKADDEESSKGQYSVLQVSFICYLFYC